MKIKCFVVVGDVKIKVAEAVEKAVNSFLSANPKVAVFNVSVNPDLSTTAGKAFVSVVYDGDLSVFEALVAPVAPAPAVPAADVAPENPE